MLAHIEAERRHEDLKQNTETSRIDTSNQSWLFQRDQSRLELLTADLFHAFAGRASSLLARTHPSFVLCDITDDSSRIPVLAKFVHSIPSEVYEEWGLSGYHDIVGERFIKTASATPPNHFPYNHYDLADMLMSRHLHPDHQRERDVLNPIFMFVHGKSFEEMNTLRKTMPPNHCCGMHGHRMVSMQSNPWTAELGKQAWRESGKRGKRSGGRKGGGRVKEGEMHVSG